MPRDFSVIDEILLEQRDLMLAFDQLDDLYDYMNHHCYIARHIIRFQQVKDRYKKLRDDGWRWLKNNHFEPRAPRMLERGDSCDGVPVLG